MKTNYATLGLLVFLSWVICSYYYLFKNPFGFTFEFNDYGQYFPAFVALSGWSLFLMLRMFVNKKSPFREHFVFFILNIFILCLVLSRHYSFANEYFTNITVVILLFAMLLSADIAVLHAVLIFFSGMFFFQLYLGYKQMGYMNGFSPDLQIRGIRGTLQNSGIFSWYLVSQLPFLYYLFFCVPVPIIRGKNPDNYKQAGLFFKSVGVIVFAIVLALVVLIIWRSQSRTATMALGVLLLSFFILLFGKRVKIFINKLPKGINWLAACAFLTGAGYVAWYLFNLKKLSAFTRIMTLDIAKDHLTDHLLTGAGIGRFAWYYPQWQAQYFATHANPPDYYFLSAGESYYLFNEYVELFCTIGFPGFIVFILLLIWFFATRSVKHGAILNAAKLTMITILSCGFTTYIFHANALLLLLAFCFATAVIVNDNKLTVFQKLRIPDQLHNTVARPLLIALVVIAGFAAYSAFEQWQAKQNWDQIRNRLAGSSAEIKMEYLRLYKSLHYDGKFLTDYGMTLSEENADCLKAAGILEEAKKYFITRLTIQTLAQAYKKAGDHRKAIENYEWLCNYIPSRFGTKLELLKLFVEVRDIASARKTANMILTMPVKLPSQEVNRIKGETAGMLERLK